MSYTPTSKSGYGDKDYTEDTWSPQGTGPNQPPPGPSYGAPLPPNSNPQHPGMGQRMGVAGGMAQMPYSQGQSMNPQYTNMQQGQSANPLVTLANTITQEDILFMRSWQRDSFVYRVVPCEVIGLGSLYWYNKTKSLPHSIPKYMGMGFVAFLFGKWLYRNEFKRRLAESHATTPYMQAMRRSLGIAPATSSEFTDPAFGGAGGGSEFDGWSSGGPTNANYTDDRQQFRSGSSQSTDYSLPGAENLDNQTNDESAKPRLTYDELRARNRGFIK